MSKDLEQLLADGMVTRGKWATPSPSFPRVIHRCGYLPLGIPQIDVCLPGGGLKRGATHEWFTLLPDGQPSRRSWFPPLSILTILATTSAGLIIWIDLHPFPGALGPLLGRSLFINPPADAPARLWAIDQALRSSALRRGAVLANAAGLDMAASRRLQLAAESGGNQGAIGLLVRPPNERSVISAAETRWQVSPNSQIANGKSQMLPYVRPRPAFAICHLPFGNFLWRLELLRCKGSPMAGTRRWIIEWAQGDHREDQKPPGFPLRACADVADRPPPPVKMAR
jgi:protein ImuA